MRKLFYIMLVLIFFGGLAFATQFPAPFDQAKRIALTTEPIRGIYLWKAEDPENPGIIFGMGYDSNRELVGLLLMNMPRGEMKHLYTNGIKYACEVYELTPAGLVLVAREQYDPERAIKFAFEFFRVLVKKNLIPSLI